MNSDATNSLTTLVLCLVFVPMIGNMAGAPFGKSAVGYGVGLALAVPVYLVILAMRRLQRKKDSDST